MFSFFLFWNSYHISFIFIIIDTYYLSKFSQLYHSVRSYGRVNQKKREKFMNPRMKFVPFSYYMYNFLWYYQDHYVLFCISSKRVANIIGHQRKIMPPKKKKKNIHKFVVFSISFPFPFRFPFFLHNCIICETDNTGLGFHDTGHLSFHHTDLDITENTT